MIEIRFVINPLRTKDAWAPPNNVFPLSLYSKKLYYKTSFSTFIMHLSIILFIYLVCTEHFDMQHMGVRLYLSTF